MLPTQLQISSGFDFSHMSHGHARLVEWNVPYHQRKSCQFSIGRNMYAELVYVLVLIKTGTRELGLTGQ